MEAKTFTRVLYCRDDSGRLRPVRVESDDPAELERVARLYAAMERRSEARERRWRERGATFTDAGVDPGQVSEAAAGRKSQAGYPWEGPRFDFALMLGESPVWSGPESLWLYEWDGGEARKVCRFCGHYREVPLVAYCLGCDVSGRDAAIPKGVPRTARKYRRSKLKGGRG